MEHFLIDILLEHNKIRSITTYLILYTVEPLLRSHPDERPPPLERPLDNVNLNINVLISTPNKRPPLLKVHFSDAKGVVSQEGFHCISIISGVDYGYQTNLLKSF